MSILRLARWAAVLGIFGLSNLSACPGNPFNINDLLRWASPLNFSLLALGGPTNVWLDGASSIGVGTNDSVAGIAGLGSLTVAGYSTIQARVEHEPDAAINVSTGSYVSNVHIEDGSDRTLIMKARSDALNGAYCMAMLTATVPNTPESLNINNPQGNITINADDQLNVVSLTDVILTNGVTVTLSSSQPSCSDQGMSPGDPNCSFPTLVVNVTGKFSMTGGAKIVLAGGLDEAHVIFNVVGTGDVQFAGDVDGSRVPTSQITGVLFAPYRNVNLAPGLVNGSVIAGGSYIGLSMGAQIVGHYNVQP